MFEGAILESLQAEDDTFVLVGDWVLVAEVYTEDGQMWLASNATEDLSYWKELGMLEAHIDIVKERANDR